MALNYPLKLRQFRVKGIFVKETDVYEPWNVQYLMLNISSKILNILQQSSNSRFRSNLALKYTCYAVHYSSKNSFVFIKNPFVLIKKIFFNPMYKLLKFPHLLWNYQLQLEKAIILNETTHWTPLYTCILFSPLGIILKLSEN